MKPTKSQAKRIQAQTTFKAWAVLNSDGQFVMALKNRARAMDAAIIGFDRVVRCEIRLIEGRK